METLRLLAEQSTATETTMSSSMDFMLMFNIFIAAYLLYYAIKGTGKVYENDYPQSMKEDHAKFLRMFCWIVGIGMLVFTILEFIQGFGSIWTTVSIIYVLGAVVVYFVIFQTRFRKFLKKPDAEVKKKK
ncbi:hypothetical protein LJC56_06850 [Christensenellaceae bacterium OttesenSCG-928-K19]|nr:hypothetical protein [Christensenellaceae bacterium OttesenSCG-928-K19]